MRILLLVLLATGCQSSTRFGHCVGLNEEKDPNLIYKYSAWNIAMGIIFSEMIIPPIIVLLDDLECPVGGEIMSLHEIKKLMKGSSPFLIGETWVWTNKMYERQNALAKGRAFWTVTVGKEHRVFNFEGDAAKFIQKMTE